MRGSFAEAIDRSGMNRLSRAHEVEPIVLGEHLHAKLLGLFELRAGAGAGDEMSVLFETEPATFAPSRSACALASSRVSLSS